MKRLKWMVVFLFLSLSPVLAGGSFSVPSDTFGIQDDYVIWTGKELMAFGDSNEEFVKNLYRLFLEREGEPEGISAHLSVFASNEPMKSREILSETFCASDEFMKNIFPKLSQSEFYPDLVKLYNRVLARNPRGLELHKCITGLVRKRFKLNLVRSGEDYNGSSIERMLLDLDERKALSHEDIVTRMFQLHLKRNPNETELAFYVAILKDQGRDAAEKEILKRNEQEASETPSDAIWSYTSNTTHQGRFQIPLDRLNVEPRRGRLKFFVSGIDGNDINPPEQLFFLIQAMMKGNGGKEANWHLLAWRRGSGVIETRMTCQRFDLENPHVEHLSLDDRLQFDPTKAYRCEFEWDEEKCVGHIFDAQSNEEVYGGQVKLFAPFLGVDYIAMGNQAYPNEHYGSLRSQPSIYNVQLHILK